MLVVDDYDDAREMLRMILEHHELDVVEARDGAEAIDSAREHRPDVVLLDLGLPRVSGWDVARALKSDPRTSDIPLIACTAFTLARQHERARDAGCRDIVVKPIDPRALVEVVRSALAR
ncbi:MAG: response regulator [Myxococcota bacterium]|nr:response regulator [Myxococcota bacterium]